MWILKEALAVAYPFFLLDEEESVIINGNPVDGLRDYLESPGVVDSAALSLAAT